MNLHLQHRTLAAMTVLAASVGLASGAAADYPDEPVRIVVP